MDLENDPRNYGIRYVDTIGEDLYIIAGRILSDLKKDQAAQRLDRRVLFVVVVIANTITVKASLTPDADGERADAALVNNRIRVVAARYNWESENQPSDERFRLTVEVGRIKLATGLLDLGAMIG